MKSLLKHLLVAALAALTLPAGAQDRIKLRAALANNPDVTFDMPADGDHCCHNLYHVVRPRMADWAAERLGGRV